MKKYILISLTLAFCVSSVLAQDRHTKKADKRYDRFEYVKAVKEYKKVIKKDRATPYVYKQLADSYYHLKDFKNAANYMGIYLDEADESDVEPEYYFRYAQLLKSEGKDAESNTYMEEFASKAPNDSRARAFNRNPNYLSKLQNREPVYELNKLGLNTGAQEFGAYEYDDKLYYVSSRNKSRRTYGWTGESTLDVYVANKKGDEYVDAKQVKGDINTKFHEGAVVITEDGKTMYFTRNDYTNRKYRKSDDGIGQLKIYSAKLVNGKWTDVNELPFTSSEYSTGNIALSPDEDMLYFTSDMPGGMGGTDLYRVAIEGDGEFGEPENLGPEINTAGNEDFPFVDSEGTLYFSSDGHLGMGGLDVFKAEARGDGFGKPENVGKDVNSRADDFSFVYYPEEKRGYVASNRAGMTEDHAISIDNIYAVNWIEVLELIVDAKVINAETGSAVPNAKVAVYDQDNNRVSERNTDRQGSIKFKLPGGDKNYSLQVSAEDYEPTSKEVPQQRKGDLSITVELSPVEKMIQEEEIVLPPIYFEFDKSEITKEGAHELDKLVAIMKKHENMKIHVIAHTDHIGPKDYNQKLSERRAKSTVDYVIDKGIDPSRIDGEGVGMSKPKIDCTKCTEDENAENRRSEFKIIER